MLILITMSVAGKGQKLLKAKKLVNISSRHLNPIRSVTIIRERHVVGRLHRDVARAEVVEVVDEVAHAVGHE